jgi:hypothetical protein
MPSVVIRDGRVHHVGGCGGLAGVIEKFMVTRVLTSLYKEELKRLEAASQQPA